MYVVNVHLRSLSKILADSDFALTSCAIDPGQDFFSRVCGCAQLHDYVIRMYFKFPINFYVENIKLDPIIIHTIGSSAKITKSFQLFSWIYWSFFTM